MAIQAWIERTAFDMNIKSTGGINSDNLRIVHTPTPWNIPTLLNANAQSLRYKMDDLQCVCDYNGVDLAIISETWKEDDCPEEFYQLSGYWPPVHKDRVGQTGGGAAIYVKNSMQMFKWEHLE